MSATVKPAAVIEPEPEGPVEQSDELDQVERELAHAVNWGPPIRDDPGHERKVEQLCLKRHGLLRDIDRRQDLATARRHRSEAAVRAVVHCLPLGTPGHFSNPADTLCGWFANLEPTVAAAAGEAAAGPLAAVLDTLEHGVRRAWLRRDAERYVALAALLPALEHLAAAEGAFWGEGEGEPTSAAVELARLRKSLEDARTQAHAAAAARFEDLRDRLGRGQILTVLEVIAIEAGCPGTLRFTVATLRGVLAAALVPVAERLCPVGADWPPAPRPAPPPPEDRPYWKASDPLNPY